VPDSRHTNRKAWWAKVRAAEPAVAVRIADALGVKLVTLEFHLRRGLSGEKPAGTPTAGPADSTTGKMVCTCRPPTGGQGRQWGEPDVIPTMAGTVTCGTGVRMSGVVIGEELKREGAGSTMPGMVARASRMRTGNVGKG